MLKSASHSWSGLVVWSRYQVEEIGGRPISYFKYGTNRNLLLQPGKQRILVFVQFEKDWLDTCPCEGRVVVSADLSAGRKYEIGGKTVDNLITVWIEDAVTSHRVSDIVSAPYVRSPVRAAESDGILEQLSSSVVREILD